MKVLVVCLFYREAGPVFSLGLSSGFASNNIDTFAVVSNKVTNKLEWDEAFDDDHIYYFKSESFKKKPFSFIKELMEVRKKFRKMTFDYVVLTFPTKGDYLISRFVSGKKCMMVLHDAIPHSSTDSRITLKLRNLLKRADYLIILSKLYKDYVEKEYGFDNNHVLYLRLGMLQYPRATNSKASTQYKRNFLFFGRIDGYKGLNVLAEAYKDLISKYENISLTVAGNGDFSDYKDSFKDLKNVNLIIRYIDDDEIMNLFMQENTVVVLPYIDASQSGVIPMAYFYGVPVIATDVGAIKEQLFDGEVGFLCEASNSASLKNAMEKFVSDTDYYINECEKMKEYSEKLTWKEIVKGFKDELLLSDRSEENA